MPEEMNLDDLDTSDLDDVLDEADTDAIAEEVLDEATTLDFGRGPIQQVLMTAAANKNKPLPFYFDLETVPDESRMESFGLEPLPEPKQRVDPSEPPEAVSQMTIDEAKKFFAQETPTVDWLVTAAATELQTKDRKGVHKLINEAFQDTDPSLAAERSTLLSTTPEFCRIVAMGFTVDGLDACSAISITKSEEHWLLEQFWHLAACCQPLVGFNILAFDLPVIFARSVLLGVPASVAIDPSPYKPGAVCDLYLRRFGPRGNTDKKRPGKLKDLCRLYEIDVPAEGVDGSQVAQLVAEQRWDELHAYQQSDIEVTRALHRRWTGYFC